MSSHVNSIHVSLSFTVNNRILLGKEGPIVLSLMNLIGMYCRVSNISFAGTLIYKQRVLAKSCMLV